MEGRLFNMGKEGACKIKKAPLMIKPSKPPEGRGKTAKPVFARGKCTPFGTAYHLPLRERWDNKTFLPDASF